MANSSHSNCTSLLQEMVQFDTVNSAISNKPDAERELSLYLETQAGNLGYQTQRLPVEGNSFNLLVTHQVDARASWLLLESHLDTVSVEGMTIDPFEGRIENNRLYGRGACDTKGTGAAMLWALQKYKQGANTPNNVAIVFTIDEEVAKTGARTFVESHLPTLDWQPAGVIVGEPTQLKLVGAHNGVARWTIQTQGVAAHSSDPSQGQSAISMMASVIDAIESHYIPALTTSHPLTRKAQCSINIISGGSQINIIPEQCEIHIDRRVVPGENPNDVIPAVEKVLDQLRNDHPEIRVTQQQPDMIDYPLDPSIGETFAKGTQTVFKQLNLPDQITGVGYGTDASTFNQAGIPAIVLGPGDIAQAHTANEWIDLEQLEKGVEVYYQIMQSPLP